LLPLPWLGARADLLAIFALALYALLPVVRNTYVGITGISEPVREAAVAMGLTSRQLLWQVEMPLASPVILAGVRVATVITIGVATIAAAIGAGGLGEFIFRGIAMVDNGVILAGAMRVSLRADAAGRRMQIACSRHHRRLEEFHRVVGPGRIVRATARAILP